MIVVDTSVWIDYFNGKESDETNILDSSLGKQEVAVGDLIVLEILRGFRSDKDYNTAKKYLANLHQFNMLSPELALKASEYYRKLRKRGVTIRKTADIIIATFCIEKTPAALRGQRLHPVFRTLEIAHSFPENITKAI